MPSLREVTWLLPLRYTPRAIINARLLARKCRIMPSLLCYLTEADLAPVVQFLNDSDEIAFIISDGPGRWIAISKIDALNLKSYVLWHIPSGALPLVHSRAPNTLIHDPWSGWEEDQSFEDGSSPYFGAGHPGIIWLKYQPVKVDSAGVKTVGMSCFSWIGNHYRIIGNGAAPVTEKWWKLLRAFVRKRAVRVTRGGPSLGGLADVWAFPEACELFAGGVSAVRNFEI